MRRSPILSSGARTRGALLALACTLVGAGRTAHADPAAPAGADALASARKAWEGKHYVAAELSYKSALDQGGLTAADTLDAYIHLGAARARLGRKDLARAAFRRAALIDLHFKTPPEAGKRAAGIAALARHDERKLGPLVLSATTPQSVPTGEAFGVDATLDPKHAAVTAKLGLDARDAVSGKEWITSEVAAPKVHFDVPPSVTLAGATLVIRIDALDPHDNRLASYEQRIQVEAPPEPPPPAITQVPARAIPAPAPAPMSFTADLGKPAPAKENAKHGGILTSPWFYIIGGAVLAAGGAFAYYELRPSDDVSLGGARVVSR